MVWYIALIIETQKKAVIRQHVYAHSLICGIARSSHLVDSLPHDGPKAEHVMLFLGGSDV